MRTCKPITNLDELIKKGAGLADRPETFTIGTGDWILEMKNPTDDEVLEYVQGLNKKLSENGTLQCELKFAKQSIYLHCPILQQYATQVDNPNRAEPWDVFDELFTPAERNDLRLDYYKKSGIIGFLGDSETKDSVKNE